MTFDEFDQIVNCSDEEFAELDEAKKRAFRAVLQEAWRQRGLRGEGTDPPVIRRAIEDAIVAASGGPMRLD